jgi:hypothetical protein
MIQQVMRARPPHPLFPGGGGGVEVGVSPSGGQGRASP